DRQRRPLCGQGRLGEWKRWRMNQGQSGGGLLICTLLQTGPLPVLHLQEFVDVVQQTAIVRRIASILLVEAGAATVEERDEITRLAQSRTRVLIPAGVALNAVDAGHVSAHCRATFWRDIAPIVAAVAIAGREAFHGMIRRRFSHEAAPF